MNLHGWVVLLRLPIEIAAACLAVTPALLLLRAWSSLPEEIPSHFGPSGRPDRWGARWQAWLLPLATIVVYGTFSLLSGAWSWLLDSQRELVPELELPVLMRLPIELLMTYMMWVVIRVARKEVDGLDLRIFYGLMLLWLTPPAAAWLLAHR